MLGYPTYPNVRTTVNNTPKSEEVPRDLYDASMNKHDRWDAAVLTSPLWTPTDEMIPHGLMSSNPIANAGLSPTTSMTTSAPRPSVSSFTLLSRPSRSVWKFQGSAPSDFARSNRGCIESTARRFFGLYDSALMTAHSPTGPHPISTTVASAICSFVISLNALCAAKYPFEALAPLQPG